MATGMRVTRGTPQRVKGHTAVATSTARVNTASSIGGVSLPVNVFC